MGKVDVSGGFSDFELYAPDHAPDQVLIPSSSTPHHREQQNHPRVANTTSSTRTLFSPALSVGDKSPSLNLTSGTTQSNSSSISRKRASPSEDHLPSPPPSTKTRKVATPASAVNSTLFSASSTPQLTLFSAPTPRSQRSQSPSLVLVTTDDTIAIKRARNTLAARRYRQKRIERLEELEALLTEADKEKERWRQEAMSWRMESEKWKGRYEGAVVGGGGSVTGTNNNPTGQQSGRR